MSKERYEKQLGLNLGTASNRLRKMIIFELVKETNRLACFRCGKQIQVLDEFSIEHKIPWLDSDSPNEMFFAWENIAFSHLSCNASAARKTNKITYASEAEKLSRRRKLGAERMRKYYSKEKRREKFKKTGY